MATSSTKQTTTSTQNTTSGSHTQTNGGSQSHQTGGSTSHQTGGATTVSGATGQVNQPTQNAYNHIWDQYQQSDAVTQAQNYLADTMNNKPGQYQSTFTDQLNNLYDQIMNRPKFQYDMNADVLFQNYRDQYMQQGRNAMQDTVGQASALSGGYDNSYAQVAGQQQYQNYLNQLNEQLPQLYNSAYQQYAQEGDQLNNLYNIASNRENQDYQKYRDTVSDWQADRAYGLQAYQDARDFDYNAYNANRQLASQEYWNQRNAQQTSNESNWANTNESNWADTTEENWQTQDTNSWQNTNTTESTTSSTSTTGTGGSGGGGRRSSGRSTKSGGSGELKMFTNSNKSNANKFINSLKSLQSRTDRSKLDNAVNTYLSARVKDGSMTNEDVDWLQHEYYNRGHWNFRTGG